MIKWTRERKKEVVEILTEELKNSKINILSSFSGLTVFEMRKIRESIKNTGGKMMVVKNNLLDIVFKNLSKDEVCKFINGPTFIIWSNQENEIEIIKSLIEFQKDTAKLEIRGGLLKGEIIDKNKIFEIGKLPGRKELEIKLVYLLKMPSIRLVNSIKSPMIKIVNILNQIKERKER